MTSLLDTIESIENSHDITVTSFPLRRDLLRTLAKLRPEQHNPERWNFWYESIHRELTDRLKRFKSTSNSNVVKRGIFKGMTYPNARIASFFLRHATIRPEFSFGDFSTGQADCVRIIYACLIFPTPGHLDFRFNGEDQRIELVQTASGRILTTGDDDCERAIVHGENVLRDFLEDVHGYTEAQLAGRTADFTWEQFRDAFEPFLVFQINHEYASRVR